MNNWDQEAVDLVKPGFIEFDEDGLGELGFIAVAGELDCRDADRDGRPGVEFSWQGSDEGDEVSGRGWAALNPDGTLEGHISSTSATIPRSAPSGSTESSGKRPIELAMGEALRPGRDTSEQCTDDHLSHAGHRTVEAMEAPDGSYQEQAARLWREFGLDLVNAGKSNQDAAVEYFGGMQRCFTVAGLLGPVRGPGAHEPPPQSRLHPRVREGRTEVTPDPEPSFLEKARPPGSAD